MIKFILVAATTAVTAVAAFVKFNKSVDKMEAENAALPAEEQLSAAELEENMIGYVIDDLKKDKAVDFLGRILKEVQGMMSTVYDFRVKAALGILAVASSPGMGALAAAKGAAYAVLGTELAYKAVGFGFELWIA